MNKFVEFLTKNKHVIFTSLSCIGVVATGLCVRHDALKESECETTKERVINYIPSMAVTSLTLASIILNHKITKSDIASLSACAGAGYKLYNNYKRKVKEIAGKETYDEVERQIAKDAERGIEHAVIPDIWSDGLIDDINVNEGLSKDGNDLFYIPEFDVWFRSSMAAVINANYHINRNFQLRGFVTMNEYLDFLGLKQIIGMDSTGFGFSFIEGGCYWIDFNIIEGKTDEGEKYNIIDFVFSPEKLTDEDGIIYEGGVD